MTPQQILDTVAPLLIAQEEPSYSPTVACAYRDAKGLRCFVGHLIPDESYDPKMDIDPGDGTGTDVHSLIQHFGDRLPPFFRTHEKFLKDAQLTHDQCAGDFRDESSNASVWGDEIRRELVNLAFDYKLDVNF